MRLGLVLLQRHLVTTRIFASHTIRTGTLARSVIATSVGVLTIPPEMVCSGDARRVGTSRYGYAVCGDMRARRSSASSSVAIACEPSQVVVGHVPAG